VDKEAPEVLEEEVREVLREEVPAELAGAKEAENQDSFLIL
jgi:hypothetical protein